MKREELQTRAFKTFESCLVRSAVCRTPMQSELWATGSVSVVIFLREGSLKRFYINYLLPTSYKHRESAPKKNIISVLLFALRSPKVKEVT